MHNAIAAELRKVKHRHSKKAKCAIFRKKGGKTSLVSSASLDRQGPFRKQACRTQLARVSFLEQKARRCVVW